MIISQNPFPKKNLLFPRHCSFRQKLKSFCALFLVSIFEVKLIQVLLFLHIKPPPVVYIVNLNRKNEFQIIIFLFYSLFSYYSFNTTSFTFPANIKTCMSNSHLCV